LIHQLSPETQYDLCIVGTGPVGMALALEFERLGRTVLILEAGAAERAEGTSATITDPDRHAPMEIAVVRALGGTSWTWGGRCVAYDDVDFLDRDFVPDAHWPLTHDDIRPWYARAAEYLLCGSAVFDIPYKRPLTGGLTLNFVERWARESRVILEHRERLLASEHILLSLSTTVAALNLSLDGKSIASLEATTPQGPVTVRARRFILAMGGVETTRLLLAAQQRTPHLFGGVDGPLGRFYMGHISGKIASIAFTNPADIADLDFTLDASGAFYRRRLMLTTEAQIEHKVLNTAFWPDNPPFYDPAHRSGVLSAVWLALSIPVTGRQLVSEGIRLAHTGPRPYPVAAHLRNAILGAPRGARDLINILRDRFLRKPKKPGFLVRNRGGKYALHYHAEQIPHPDSRITLSSERDASGLPRAVIDLRFQEQDVDSVLTSHRLLDEALRLNNLGRLEYWSTPDKLREKVWAAASDGYHQVGTTRMGADPATSVVDPDLRVHGLTNLYIASSSVFPTTGQANSTFLAVAFAVRLASFLTSASQDSTSS
jgi:choline dehydrogenase-like flavoprotein